MLSYPSSFGFLSIIDHCGLWWVNFYIFILNLWVALGRPAIVFWGEKVVRPARVTLVAKGDSCIWGCDFFNKLVKVSSSRVTGGRGCLGYLRPYIIKWGLVGSLFQPAIMYACLPNSGHHICIESLFLDLIIFKIDKFINKLGIFSLIYFNS